MEQQSAPRIGNGQGIIIYARASQYNELDRTSTAQQVAAGRELAEALGYTISESLTIVEDSPNTSLTRDGIARLIGAIASGEATAIVVHTLDRLGRHESEGLETLLRELRRRNVPLYIAKVAEGYAYDPATGKLSHDPEAVHQATMREWQPPEFIVIPRENEQDERFAEQLPRIQQTQNGQDFSEQ